MSIYEMESPYPKPMFTDSRFVSTLDDPLKFFKAYLRLGGEAYMHEMFTSYKEPDGEYDEGKDLICIQKCLPAGIHRGALLDEETKCREYFLSFPDYVNEEFSNQARTSDKLIRDRHTTNGDGQDLKLYKKILIDCVDIHKEIHSSIKLNFLLQLSFLMNALYNAAVELFERYHSKTSESIIARKYFQNIEDTNISGFKLKGQVRCHTLRDFYDRLIEREIIKNNDIQSFDEFLRGEIPKRKINWLKAPHELKFFIDQLCDITILEEVPGQRWKYLDQIFICQGNELSPLWYKHHNKLKDKGKIALMIDITHMLLPKT